MIDPNKLRAAASAILKTDYDWRSYNKFNEAAAQLADALPEMLAELNKRISVTEAERVYKEGLGLREVIRTLKREKNLVNIACDSALKLRDAAATELVSLRKGEESMVKLLNERTAELAEAKDHIARLSDTLATHADCEDWGSEDACGQCLKCYSIIVADLTKKRAAAMQERDAALAALATARPIVEAAVALARHVQEHRLAACALGVQPHREWREREAMAAALLDLSPTPRDDKEPGNG